MLLFVFFELLQCLIIDCKLTKVYYCPKGYWKGIAAIKKLVEAKKVPEETAKQWLFRQAL